MRRVSGAPGVRLGHGTGASAGEDGRSHRGGSAGVLAGPSKYNVAAPATSTSTAQPATAHRRIDIDIVRPLPHSPPSGLPRTHSP
ncbi:hypothetical protein OG429_03790 [Streptomyces sp. NBC_00190]|uniref:hypothetical protein n=1 Tax=unclassified Streptomyces TaxID=2593676 RepID=UPI002E286C37|nr:hypothetical protein [Streptomyces sp. NBC_00190]WSZ38519.1 hypothetical protein OG239_06795 [Streptomyces sp. NBC_00868]